jgi:DNA invertase Pin-like site-specific DNA recombinase
MSQTIASYLLVSSKSQDVAGQEPELRRWAAQQDGEVRWYRDRFTGKTIDRPAFTRLLRHVRSGEVQQVAVWRLDRLGRTAKGLTAQFVN